MSGKNLVHAIIGDKDLDCGSVDESETEPYHLSQTLDRRDRIDLGSKASPALCRAFAFNP
jgi:hypothetical protein